MSARGAVNICQATTQETTVTGIIASLNIHRAAFKTFLGTHCDSSSRNHTAQHRETVPVTTHAGCNSACLFLVQLRVRLARAGLPFVQVWAAFYVEHDSVCAL